MKKYLFFFANILTFAGLVFAQVPQIITHQGFLTDSAGQGVNATPPMSFRFFADSTGGTTLLELSFSGVQVTNGAFSVALDVSSLSFNKQFWLETEVNAEVLTPRTRLTSVPYALTAMTLLGPNSEATGVGAIAGGMKNKARGDYSVVSGGGGPASNDSNLAKGNYSIVSGGKGNRALGENATISGGSYNEANVERTTISGGSFHDATGIVSTISGGYSNKTNGDVSTISGGSYNEASGLGATIGGGYLNKARGLFSVVSGGGSDAFPASDTNSALGDFSTVSGGRGNRTRGEYATVSGGGFNRADGDNSSISGGSFNEASGMYATIGGGHQNEASRDMATVNGGAGNTASGIAATVDGGYLNTASGNYSFAAGRHAQANHTGAFVWADSSGTFSTYFTSTAPNQFLIRASGGVGIGTADPDNALHVMKHSAGNVTAYGNAPLVVEDSTNTYIHILSPANREQGIMFGDPSIQISGALILTNSNEMDFRAGGNSTRMLIDADGDVGIGTMIPGNILTVKQNSTTDPIADAWTTYSSRRWKTDIETLEGALEKVEKLRGVSYKEKATGKECIGLIAEEVGAVIPEVVEYEENGVDAKSVDYARLVSVLIEAVKEQQATIKQLTQEVRSLTSYFMKTGNNSPGESR